MKKKKILILGINSYIGSYLKKKFPQKLNIYGTSHRKKDLNNKIYFLDLKKPNINIIKKEMFDVIVLCAGKNNLEFCQNKYKEAFKINYLGIKKVIKKSIIEGIFVIFISSNLVFDGKKKFYKSTDKPSPKSNYGKLKLKVENFLRKHKKESYCILRLTKVYSNKDGLISKWRKKIKLNQVINLDCGFKISPISIVHVSKYLLRIILKKTYGIFHLSNKKEFTLKEFLFTKIGQYKKIIIQNNNYSWRSKYNSLKIKAP